MEESTLFQFQDVKITNARFISRGQTYAMDKITAVKPYKQPPKRLRGAAILLVGLAIMLKASLVFGLCIAAAAAYYLYKQKPLFHVVVATAAGETKAFVTYQRDYLEKVLLALDDALLQRG